MNIPTHYLRNGSIAVIDSGIGGVTVLSELIKLMPYESYIYFGDLKNSPYGEKNTDAVKELTFSNVDMLINKGAKAIVIACNTATGAAAKELREKYSGVPVIGIEPAIKPAVTTFPQKHIIIMATPLTLKQEKFEILYNKWNEFASVEPLPCPGLASLIEQGHVDDSVIKSYLLDLFSEHKTDDTAAIVLGCTHYPLIKKLINEMLPHVRIFDGGEGTARQTKRLLEERGLLNNSNSGNVEILTSAEGPEAMKFAGKVMTMTEMLFKQAEV